MYYLLGIDDTDSPMDGNTSSTLPAEDTAKLALKLGQKLESLALARLINISNHQLFLHPSVPHTSDNTACCLLLDCETQKTREIDLTTRQMLRSECASTANPGYALAAWNQFDLEVVAWGKTAKIAPLQRLDAITLARRSGIAIAGLTGSGAGVIGALSAIGLRFEGSDGYISWMPGLEILNGVFTRIEINQFVQFESIESDHHKHPAMDDRIRITGLVKPILREGRIVLPVIAAKKGEDFEWQA